MSEHPTDRPIQTPLSYRVRLLRHRIVPIAVWLLTIAALVTWSRGQVNVLTGVGIVESRRIDVSPVVDGTVRSLAADIFDSIEEGQVLALMDDTLLGAELLVAEAELAQLRSTVVAENRRLETELSRLETDTLNDVRRFQMDEEEARLDYLDMVVQQEADTVKLERFKIQMDRYEEVAVRQNLGEAETYDDNRLRYHELKKEVEERVASIIVAKQALDNATLRRVERESGEAIVMDTGDFLAPIRQALSVQEARITGIKQRRAMLVLTAPVSGQISRIFHHPGETVLAGDPVLAITDTSSLRVLAYVDERSAGQIQEGNEVRLQSQGRTERIATARVARAGTAFQELPISLRLTPILPEWGFPVLISDIPRGVFLPGERLSVRIKAGPQQ